MSSHFLVTGVSQGVGLTIAGALADAGHTVHGISRRHTPEFEKLAAAHPGRVRFLAFDLADTDRAKSAVFDEWLTHDVPLAGYINNAAVAYDDLITNLDVAVLQGMYAVNVFTPMVLTKYAIRNMLLHQVRGSIVHVSSISAHTGYKGLAMYASTKGALEAFSKNTAREWGGRGIRSNCVVPGFMETAMSGKLDEEQRRRIYQRTALKQATDVASVAATVRFLVGPEAASITGQNIFVDSGTL